MTVLERIQTKRRAFFHETGANANRVMLPPAEAKELTDFLDENPVLPELKPDESAVAVHGFTIVEGDEFKVWRE